MPTNDERIAELEVELARLKEEEGRRPLTVPEIRKLSPEQASREWERIKAGLAELEADAGAAAPAADAPPAKTEPAPVGVERLRQAYAQKKDAGGEGGR